MVEVDPVVEMGERGLVMVEIWDCDLARGTSEWVQTNEANAQTIHHLPSKHSKGPMCKGKN